MVFFSVLFLGIASTGHEYMSTPLTPLMDNPSSGPMHRKVKARTASNTSTSSKGRLYSYVSGSEGDDDDENDTSSSSNRKQRRHWRKGSHSTISSSNDMDTYRMRNDQVSHLSLSEDSDGERYSEAGNAGYIIVNSQPSNRKLLVYLSYKMTSHNGYVYVMKTKSF